MWRFLITNCLGILSLQAQGGPASHVASGPKLPVRCSYLSGDIFFLTSGNTGLYTCGVGNTFSVGPLSSGVGVGTTITTPILINPTISQINDVNGNAWLISTPTVKAVDQLTFTNAATANPANVTIAATGTDTNISLSITPKGTGSLVVPQGVAGTPGIAFAGSLTTGLYWRNANCVAFTETTNPMLDICKDSGSNQLLRLPSTSVFTWAASGTSAVGGVDVSIQRDATGVVGVTNGSNSSTTLANYRDLRLRHYLASGTVPTLTVGTGTIAGADAAGRVTLTAGAQTTLTVTFGTAYVTNVPICIANDETTSMLIQASPTLSTLVLNAVAFGAADLITWICIAN